MILIWQDEWHSWWHELGLKCQILANDKCIVSDQ